MFSPKLIAIALYLTASLRLVSLPVSDTIRFAFLAVVVLVLGIDRRWRLNVGFAITALPLIGAVLVPSVFDILFRDFGYFAAVIWVQFLSALMVANTVYNLSWDEIRRLLLICLGLLLLHYVYLTVDPSGFAARGGAVGIDDNFVAYGAALTRIYYAYFQANIAAYSVFAMLLCWMGISQRIYIPRLQYLTVIALFCLLIVITGSRGALMLLTGFMFFWLLTFRSTGAALFVAVASLAGVLILPLYSAVVRLVFLREQSNEERLEAIGHYLGFIRENPILGLGLQAIRDRVEAYGYKPSHLFFVEVMGTFGVVFGSAIIVFLIYMLVVRPRGLALRMAGFFGLSVGFFNNSLLTAWAFIPLFLPVFMALGQTSRMEASNPGPEEEPEVETGPQSGSTFISFSQRATR